MLFLLIPASLTLDGQVITEDHRHEQFFFDRESLDLLRQLAFPYAPLCVCCPSLAATLTQPYLLLDRDTRFASLNFQEFDLLRPRPVDFDFDAVFLDPPFANVTPKQLAEALRVLGANDLPLYVGYNVKRQEEVLAAFEDFYLQPTSKFLSYKSGVMPGKIKLFSNVPL